jgi:aldose 1-epimerase
VTTIRDAPRTCGDEYELSLQSTRTVRAVITSVGAGIRSLSVDGVALCPDYDTRDVRPFYSGVALAPWPNRIRDGRWSHDGVPHQLDITEPDLGNALHGLLCFTEYRIVHRGPGEISLAAPVHPQHGYPFHLHTEVRYVLTDDGLRVTHFVRNSGDASAPVALGAHPFLTVGDVPADQLILTVAADSHIEVDSRLNPVGVHRVDGTRWDLRSGCAVAELDLDDAWTDLHIVAGTSTHTLYAPDGRSVSLCADQTFGHVHVFVTRRYPRAGRVVTAVAVEPMTAPADAFNSQSGLRWLAPGEAFSASWSIRYREDGP